MADNDSWIGPADRVALLRHGIVVLEADPLHSRLAVTGVPENRVIDVVHRQIGDSVSVEVVDKNVFAKYGG